MDITLNSKGYSISVSTEGAELKSFKMPLNNNNGGNYNDDAIISSNSNSNCNDDAITSSNNNSNCNDDALTSSNNNNNCNDDALTSSNGNSNCNDDALTNNNNGCNCGYSNNGNVNGNGNGNGTLEVLWNADATFWGRSSPVLFPNIGNFRNNTYTVDGKEYTLEKHGFARNMDFKVSDKTDTHARFTIESTPETLCQYPFEFQLDIEYDLCGPLLNITYTVTNRQAQGDIFYHIGGHPGFFCPFRYRIYNSDCSITSGGNDNSGDMLSTADEYSDSNSAVTASKACHNTGASVSEANGNTGDISARADYSRGTGYTNIYTGDISAQASRNADNRTCDTKGDGDGGHTLDDYILEFDSPVRLEATVYDLHEKQFSASRKKLFAEKSTTLQLKEGIFCDDALFFRNIPSKSVTLRDTISGKAIKFSYPDFCSVAFWKPDTADAHFICFEPWNGGAIAQGESSELSQRYDIRQLSAGSSKQYRLSVELL